MRATTPYCLRKSASSRSLPFAESETYTPARAYAIFEFLIAAMAGWASHCRPRQHRQLLSGNPHHQFAIDSFARNPEVWFRITDEFANV
jgi:hypothetical protein